MNCYSFRLRGRFAVLLTAAVLFFFTGPGSFDSLAHTPEESIFFSGYWLRDENGWRLYNQRNSSYPAGQWVEYGGSSYYFMNNGYMATGWCFLNNHWYFFNPYEGRNQGAMVRGWIQDPESGGWFYTNEIGIMATGWHKINGHWYYFKEEAGQNQGLMAVSQVIDGAYVNADGQMNELR